MSLSQMQVKFVVFFH